MADIQDITYGNPPAQAPPPAYSPPSTATMNSWLPSSNFTTLQPLTASSSTFVLGKAPTTTRVFGSVKHLVYCDEGIIETFYVLANFVGQWALYGILGYTTGKVVRYQNTVSSGPFECQCPSSCSASQTCQPSLLVEELPTKNLVYLAGGLFCMCKILAAVLMFVKSRNGMSKKAGLLALYGEITATAKNDLGAKLPKIALHDFDMSNLFLGVLGIVGIGGGNWLIAKDHVAYGLFAAVVASTLLAYAIMGFIRTQEAVRKSFTAYIRNIITVLEESMGPAKVKEFWTDLRELE